MSPSVLTAAAVGWSGACRERGVEALSAGGVEMPGRFLHLGFEDLRMRDVAPLLADYRALLAATAGDRAGV